MFRLVRYFSITSAIVLFAVTAALANLCRQNAGAEEAQNEEHETEPRSRGETILVVEDDPDVRILAADVAGYSRLMQSHEEGTLARLRALRGEMVDPAMDAFAGRLVKTMGDGLLIEFPSAVDAVHNGVEIQRALADQSGGQLFVL